MLTHIRVKNFKSWRDSGEVKLAPLTGFFGTNSSGKSSLLQMLLLLKQTIGHKAFLFFGDESSLVNLGSFRDVVHGHDTDALLELEYGCEPQEALAIEALGQRPDGTTEEFPGPIRHFTFNISGRGGANHFGVEHFRYGLDSREVPEIQWRDNILSRKDWFGEEQRWNVERMSRSQSYLFDHGVLRPFTSAFEHQFSHVYYLGPARVTPQRSYHWEGEQPEAIGQSGDETIDALLAARVDRLTTPSENGTIPIEERISAWLREMALAHAFSLKRTGPRHGKNYELRIQQSQASPAVTLVDTGYGLSQFLPVLVFCYYAPEGSTLILEQPGMHLHPKVQSQLADLLIEVVTKRNLQVLVESHSEHLLTRLQLRIAEEKIGADETALYFCENNAGVSKIKTLDMDELGNIKNWPPDFFGTVRGDLVKMTKAQMKRQKRTEG